jgi:hypothetical protein
VNQIPRKIAYLAERVLGFFWGRTVYIDARDYPIRKSLAGRLQSPMPAFDTARSGEVFVQKNVRGASLHVVEDALGALSCVRVGSPH